MKQTALGISKQKNYLTINEFARLTRASARSLRYYDKIGLFHPEFVDDETGYRYYALRQIYQLNLIRFCIEEGIPTDKVRENMDANDSLIDGKQFFMDCYKLSQERYRRSYGAMLRLQSYNEEYARQLSNTGDVRSRKVTIDSEMLLVHVLDSGKQTNYSTYLDALSSCLKAAEDYNLISLAHQGVVYLEDNKWYAFVSVHIEDGIGDALEAGSEYRLVYLPKRHYLSSSVYSADIERGFENSFADSNGVAPVMVTEAWVYSTFLDIFMFEAYYPV